MIPHPNPTVATTAEVANQILSLSSVIPFVALSDKINIAVMAETIEIQNAPSVKMNMPIGGLALKTFSIIVMTMMMAPELRVVMCFIKSKTSLYISNF